MKNQFKKGKQYKIFYQHPKTYNNKLIPQTLTVFILKATTKK